LCDRLRNPVKKKRGRPPSKRDDVPIEGVKLFYQMLLELFQNEVLPRSTSKKNLPPPHERAARQVQKVWFKNMDWKAVLNLLSSQK
jgi:hypothetical protein